MTTPIWSFPPNWASGVEDSREYRTEVLVTRSGKEQRRALRDTPRRRIEFTATVTADRLRHMIRLLNRQQNKTMLMPDWVTFVRTSEPIAGGANSTTVAAVPSWVVAGAQLILLDGEVVETRTVQSVAGNTITFTSGGAAWPAGVKLHRALPGLLASELTMTLPTNAVGTVPVSFEVDPGAVAAETWPLATASLGDWEVFERRWNWGGTIQSIYSFPISTVDYGRGVVAHFRPVDFGTTTRRASFIGMNRSDVDALVGCFHRAKGRRGEFHVSSWVDDMTLRQTLPANNAFMRIVGQEIFASYEDETVHRAVAIYLTNGSVYYRTITEFQAVTDGIGSDTIVQLSAGLPVEILPETVLRISWLPRHRFGSDTLNVNWLTDEVAEVDMAFVTLENSQGF